MAFHGFSLSLSILSRTCFFGEKKGPSDGIALKGTGYGSGEQLPSSTAAPAKIVYMYDWLFMASLYRPPFYHRHPWHGEKKNILSGFLSGFECHSIGRKSLYPQNPA